MASYILPSAKPFYFLNLVKKKVGTQIQFSMDNDIAKNKSSTNKKTHNGPHLPVQSLQDLWRWKILLQQTLKEFKRTDLRATFGQQKAASYYECCRFSCGFVGEFFWATEGATKVTCSFHGLKHRVFSDSPRTFNLEFAGFWVNF